MPQGRPLHVGIEAARLLQERRGIGRYVRRLLLHMPVQRPDIRLTLYIDRRTSADEVRTHLADISPALATQCAIASLHALPESDADVVWYPWNWITVPARRAPLVPTVLDVAPMLQLDHRWWKVLKRHMYRQRYTSTVQRAELIIAISEFTASEIRRLLPVDPERLRVTLLATDHGDSPARASSTSLATLGIDGPFFLTVGAQEARKNLAVLYRAMAILHARGETVPLVQCGPSVKRARYPWLHHVGFVDDGELATLYRDAAALVFPSRYEGFGLPALEAMAAGGRVVCANSSSLPEVVGDAALLFAWDDADALAAQLTRILHDDVLRDRLTLAGAAQSMKFNWSATAAATLAVFEEAATRGPLRRAHDQRWQRRQ